MLHLRNAWHSRLFTRAPRNQNKAAILISDKNYRENNQADRRVLAVSRKSLDLRRNIQSEEPQVFRGTPDTRNASRPQSLKNKQDFFKTKQKMQTTTEERVLGKTC